MEKISRLNPLLEVVKSSPRRVNKILIQKEKGQKKISEIIRLVKAKHIPFLFVPKQRLDRLDPNHQGVMALITPKEFSSLGSILSSAAAASIFLYEVVRQRKSEENE